MKKTVRKNVSVSVRAPAFTVAKIDRLTNPSRGRSSVILFLLSQGLIDLWEEEAVLREKQQGRTAR